MRIRRKSDSAQNVNSEAAWLRKRGAAIKAAAQRWLRRRLDAPVRAQLEADTAAAWGDDLQKESEQQQKKRFLRLVQADKAGLALPVDRGNREVFLEKKQVLEKRQEASHRRNDREAKRRRSILEAPVRPRFRVPAGPVHVDSSLTARKRQAVCAALRGIDVCRDRTDATQFIVPDVTAPSQRTQWACVLLGGRICDPAWVTTRGRSGFCLQYRAATAQSRRQVWGLSRVVRETRGSLPPPGDRSAKREFEMESDRGEFHRCAPHPRGTCLEKKLAKGSCDAWRQGKASDPPRVSTVPLAAGVPGSEQVHRIHMHLLGERRGK